MTRLVNGLHHVTAIAGDARRNVDFYTKGLGLRLVKRTVNFDDPSAWHLYYGDETGSPGGVMTFFVWRDAPAGRIGAGQVSVIQFAAPRGSLAFWRDRVPAQGGRALPGRAPFGDAGALFADPDGLPFAIVEADDPRTPWTTDAVGADVALHGFRGVTLRLRDGAGVARILTKVFGYAHEGDSDGVARLRLPGSPAGVVDLDRDPAAAAGGQGVGTVHHVAFSTPDAGTQATVRTRMAEAGLQVTPPIDRDYFHAIYARTPGGVLFEVATDEPGFTVDEPVATLGASLRLPRRHEPDRARIARTLAPLER